jgi:methanogenic corrinoid protein MtbC1|tara:strand:+ start:2734 stop:3615 length:882 start_codon:yes stop_codon:yes gene_type:complete
MKYLNSKEVSGILGINISTLKRWTDSGKLGCEKTAGGHRKFTMQHVRDYYKNNSNSLKGEALSLETKDHKKVYGLINQQDYKQLAILLADSSLKSDDSTVGTIVNGLYMNGTPVADLFDFVVDVAGNIVENKLKQNQIVHTDAYLSRKLITRSVDGLNRNKPNGNSNGKNALCVNFEDNLPDIGVVMSEVLMRHNGYNVFNSGSHAQLGELSEIIINRNIDIVLFYLCNLQCCNAVVEENVSKTVKQIYDSIKIAEKLEIQILFGGEGLFLLDDINDKIDNSFLTYNDLRKLI